MAKDDRFPVRREEPKQGTPPGAPAKAEVPTPPPAQPGDEKRVLTPAQPQPPGRQFNSGWDREAEEYLEASGWVRVAANETGHSLWNDPLGSAAKPVRTPTAKLPSAGGGEEQLHQWVTPPVHWSYLTDQAVLAQRQRDMNGASLADVISLKEKELAELRARLAKSV